VTSTERDARWLVGTSGLDALEACVRLLAAGRDELGVATGLRRQGLDAGRASLLLDVALARRRMQKDHPHDVDLVFTRSALEQASHPVVAAWRARRGATATERWDLCAGAGRDALALARHGRVVAVEADPVRVVLLAHNARVRGLEIDARLGDALQVRPPSHAHVHADPSRREGGRRLRALSTLVPPVDRLISAHGTVRSLGIALPPALALDDPILVGGEVEFVQVGGRLVEAALWLGDARHGGRIASATILSGSGDVADVVTRGRTDRTESLEVGALAGLIVEPAPAAIRARIHHELGREIGARRVDERRALLTVDTLPPASPWYRARRIEATFPPRPKAIRAWLRRHDDLPVEIRLHGVDADPESWWRRLGSPPRGPGGRHVELVRTSTGVRVLITVPTA
jgi:hypothetical protein